MKQALKSQKKRRESVGEVISTRRGSITPRLTKSSILHQSPKRNYTRRYMLEETEAGVQWDPHIDAFEILRAKITGITRSMQEFHVQELFQDELLAEERRKRTSSYLPKTTTSSPLILNKSHRRIRSQSFLYSSFESPDIKPCIQDTEDDEEEEKSRLLTSPNLSALFLTTNNLINSRLDELSETASIKSNNENATDLLEWQKQFLNLVTSCIHQSEALESLSTDVLATEHRVRELMLINKTIHEQFQEREKQYEERIRECQEVAQQQLIMIDSLEELTADINIKIESFQREQHRTEALLVLNGQKKDQEEPHRWSFQKSVADLMHMDDKYDVVQKMRWEIGMFVGGGVGTGHVIHTFEDKLNGIDMMIAGTGTTSSPPYHFRNSSLQSMVSNTSSKHMSSSSFHLHYPNKASKYTYMVHINVQFSLVLYPHPFNISSYTNINISYI
ncbi:uncharacterized protein B0P05DRAFT_509982 [Gilbertella persicaria]|uniref:uncharacterized protein n=1 Tax=Gilbertella persicaria TaxID=101096 RepID=UPI00221F8E49|nr:uncharacterized protein B0P05DRAFT_509982 [Gilbertella persicaria]KAI8079638.1 hypothetical protein B0P05DRAFT_509982 [Gilbertella persicaria]